MRKAVRQNRTEQPTELPPWASTLNVLPLSRRNYFFPPHAHWAKGRSGLQLQCDKTNIKRGSGMRGVRLHPTDAVPHGPNAADSPQFDLANAVDGLATVRSMPGLERAVLSTNFLQTHEAEHRPGKRVRLGLAIPDNPDYAEDKVAAQASRRNLSKVIKKSGFSIAKPKAFDTQSGIRGFRDYASAIQLRRRYSRWPWLLLLLLLLPLLFHGCPEAEFAGIAISTKSFVFVIDHSPSMEPGILIAKNEIHRLLNDLVAKKSPFSKYNVDLIAYDKQARSALGHITELAHPVPQELQQFLNDLPIGNGTHLESAIELAAREIREHGKPTSLIIVTDAEDDSIESMTRNINQVRAQFGGIPVEVEGLVLRGKSKGSARSNEKAFQALCALLSEKPK